MTLYSLALFIHIVGALGLFIGLGLEWASLWYLRRATTAEQAQQWLLVFALLRRLYPAAWAAILLAGIYMTATVWGGVAWIGVAFAAMFLLPILGAAISGRRLAAIGPALTAEQGWLSPALRQQLRDPLLWVSIQVRLAIAVGIVFLMTVKPGLGEALLALGLAVVLGLASALPAWSRVRLQEAREEN
jgi:hypothetical protein